MSTPKNRREFNKTAALLAATSLGLATAQADAAQPSAPADPLVATTQALMDVIRTRYGKHLSEDQLKRLRPKIVIGLRVADMVRQVRLNNSDEPAFTFSADV